MGEGLLRRSGLVMILAAGTLALAGAMAVAANGPYGYDFGVGGGGGTACSTQTQTASASLAPDIKVELNSESPSGQNSANFTAANTSCSMLSGAQWAGVTLGGGYVTFGVNDSAGQNIKLMGGTGPLQPGVIVKGNWEL